MPALRLAMIPASPSSGSCFPRPHVVLGRGRRSGVAMIVLLLGLHRLAAQASPALPATVEDPRALEAAAASDRLAAEVNVADPPHRSRLVGTFGPYTRHSGPGPYNSKPAFTTWEWEATDRRSIGLSHFRNSFWQPCWFAHVGRRFSFRDRDAGFFVKIAGGIIYGYRAPHEKSVPLNYRGISPAIVPSFGYKFKHTSVHLVVFGKNAGQMPMLSQDLR